VVANVLVITNNLKQASFRLRIEALVEILKTRGISLDIQVRPRGILARRQLLKTASQYDAVILQRKMLDPFDTRLLREKARKLFFDVDDAVMFHSRPVGPIERWRTRRRFTATAAAADRVVAGNEYLAELFRRQGAKTIVLPTVVDPAHYQIKLHAQTQSPKLVWIGSKSTMPYLRQFAGMLEQSARRVTGLKLITIADVPFEGAPLPVEHVPWSVETESAALCRGDIGIAPTPVDQWTLGKCGFKIVQYMAAGLPVIASPVGANQEIVVEGQTGFVPENPNEWADAIVKLANDCSKRQTMGAAGRTRLEEQFSTERAADAWAGLLEDISAL